MCMCIYIYTYIHIHTLYTRTHTYTHTRVNKQHSAVVFASDASSSYVIYDVILLHSTNS